MSEQNKKVQILSNLRSQLGDLITGGKVEENEKALDYAVKCIKNIEAVCPFCKEDDFDLIGLKHHMTTYCKVYSEVEEII